MTPEEEIEVLRREIVRLNKYIDFLEEKYRRKGPALWRHQKSP